MVSEKKVTGDKGSSQDVEMKDVSNDSTTITNGKDKKDGEKKDTDLITLEELREHSRSIDKSVTTKEPRFMYRVIRALHVTRKKLNVNVMNRLLRWAYANNAKQKKLLTSFLEESMEVDGSASTTSASASSGAAATTGAAAAVTAGGAAAATGAGAAAAGQQQVKSRGMSSLLPEQDAYFHLLLVLHIIDSNRYKEAKQCSDALMEKLSAQNRRTLDMIAARCYFYYARTYELLSELASCRSFLHSKLRTATLRCDYEGQATLINLLLRNYLHYNLFEQADKLVSKSTFPESANNNEWARYLFYLGKIKAIQLEYTEAHKYLLQAIRKAPQHSAVGFKQIAHKFAITVELLLGEIPERATFRQPSLKKTLAPYFQLTQAVLHGNLKDFNGVLKKFGDKFKAEQTWTLIIRLRHNVIKTGVRQISVSYSRISLADIGKKLQVDSKEDAEYIVAKAIRDGVIEASIDHEHGWVKSADVVDVYCTAEPQHQFHQRITFCLDTHNQCVKAMRYPDKSYQKGLESAEDRREREQQDLELAKEMADEDDEGFP